MISADEYHLLFHQILGRVTTIRSGSSVLEEDYRDKFPPDAMEIIKAMNQESKKLVTDLLTLKELVYKKIVQEDKSQSVVNS